MGPVKPPGRRKERGGTERERKRKRDRERERERVSEKKRGRQRDGERGEDRKNILSAWGEWRPATHITYVARVHGIRQGREAAGGGEVEGRTGATSMYKAQEKAVGVSQNRKLMLMA